MPLRQGDAVIFAVSHRPVKGTRGNYRVNLRHGVSRLRSGHRHTLGVIFHDATLRAMLAERPGDGEALLAISGVGQAKLERYGERFLSVLRAAR